MPAKKPKQQPKAAEYNFKIDDTMFNGIMAEDITTVLGESLVDTIDMSTITIPSYSTSISTGAYTSNNWNNYTITGSNGYSADVEINSKGLDLKNDADIKIEGRSFKEFMNSVEEQLAILRPAPELEERWEQLKELRQQYESLKADILEKEKIMKILKE